MPEYATGEANAPSSDAPPAPPLAQPKRGGFKIPKLPPKEPSPNDASTSAAAAVAVPGDEDTHDPSDLGRKDRKHKGTRKHKHLLVLDLNGLLVDRRMAAFAEADGTKRAPDAKFGKFFIYNRPHMVEFVNWLSDHFTVGVWSSAQTHNAKLLVNHIWGKHRDKLAFVWGQDRCTHVGAMETSAPNSKPILLKDLNELWRAPSYARFGPRNTLLIDDSPYKAVMNPPNSAIHPEEYKLVGFGGDDGENTKGVNATKPEKDAPSPAAGVSLHENENESERERDNLLGPGGSLRLYLQKLAEGDFVDAFVEKQPWAKHGKEAPMSDLGVMRRARAGGEAVLAAATAAAAGLDANEIELPEDSDEDNLDADGTKATAATTGISPVVDADGWGGSDDELLVVGEVEKETDEAEKGQKNKQKQKRGRRDESATRKETKESTSKETKESIVDGEGDQNPDQDPVPKKKRPRKVFTGSGACLFIRRWAWKREAKSDTERFDEPYLHPMEVRSGSTVPMGFDAEDGDKSVKNVTLSFRQTRFDDKSNNGAAGGFASTVWDSAIVLAKYIEKHQERFRGLRVCELGAGCGLVATALLHAGASRVVATDLAPNLPLLRENLGHNAPPSKGTVRSDDHGDAAPGNKNQNQTDASLLPGEGDSWDVRALSWGNSASSDLNHETFDLVVATDCMYVVESAEVLVQTLVSLVGRWANSPTGEIQKTARAAGFPVLMSYGRNRQAEAAFEKCCKTAGKGVTHADTTKGTVSGKGVTHDDTTTGTVSGITITGTDIAEDDLDELYQCSDVRVVKYAVDEV